MNKKPTPEEIQSLRKDWFKNLREDGSFIHKNTTNTFDRHVSKGESLSTYLVGKEPPATDLIRTARHLAQNTVTLLTGKRLKVTVGGGSSYSITDAVNVATDYFDDPSLSPGEKTDILIGLAVHEASHINNTDFDKLQKEANGTDPVISEMKKRIWNTLEDERIEYITGEHHPGMADYLSKVKKHYFGKRTIQDIQSITEPLPRLLNAMHLCVRYPAEMSEQMITDCYCELNKIKDILTPYPLTTEDVWTATERIMDIIRDMFKNDNNQPESQDQQQDSTKDNQNCSDQQPPDGNNPNSNQEDGGSNNNQQGQGTETPENDGQNDKMQSYTPETKNPATDKNSGQGGDNIDPEDTDKKISEALKTKEAETVMQDIANDQDRNSSQNDCSEIHNSSFEKDYANDDAYKERICINNHETVCQIRKSKGDKSTYDRSLNRVRKYIPSVSRALACKTEERDWCLSGEKSGRLNMNKLPSLRTGNRSIFTKSGHITSDSVCVCILIDESSSMSKNDRHIAARDTAILINEAVKRISHVEFFAYGYTTTDFNTGETARLNIYCERKVSDNHALSSNGHHNYTPTAEAMIAAAKRIRRLTQNKCLMIILTDGMPDSVTKVMEAENTVRKMNFIPIGVGIDSDCEDIKEVFQQSMIIEDLGTLARQLGNTVKKHLLNTIQKHETI